jgi:hypothetical protein
MRRPSLAFVLTLAALSGGPAAARADKPRPEGQVTVFTSYPEDAPNLKGRPVMISVIANGAVVQQSEVELGALKIFYNLPPGGYEVRAEGDGLAGLVKKGIAVTDKGDTELRFPMRAGKGVKVVEYAAAEPRAWQEIADRVKRLEQAVEELKGRK